MSKRRPLTIGCYLDRLTGGYQLSIADDDGGYRLAGPKFTGNSSPIVTRALTERDMQVLEAYIKKARETLP